MFFTKTLRRNSTLNIRSRSFPLSHKPNNDNKTEIDYFHYLKRYYNEFTMSLWDTLHTYQYYGLHKVF